MSRSRARLAADWFAKLRQNAVTQEVEHTDVVAAEAEALEAKADAAAVGIIVGPTGPQGPAGSNGATGATGARGATGPAGSPIVAAGAVGSYTFARCSAGGTVSAGSTVAGSSLTYACVSGGGTLQSGSPAGTWRCMGYRSTSTTVVTTYLRVS